MLSSCARLRWSAGLLPLLALPLFGGCTAAPAPAHNDDEAAVVSLYLRSRVASGLAQFAEARDLLRHAAALRPGCVQVQVALAQLLEAAGDEAGASVALDSALASAPDDLAANLMQARVELRVHQLEPALDRLLKVEAGGAADAELFALLHPLLLYTGDLKRGLAIFERARERMPEHAFVHEACADFLACLGREEEALASYRRALALDPTRRSAELKAARLLEQQGDRILHRLAAPADPGVGLAPAASAPRGSS